MLLILEIYACFQLAAAQKDPDNTAARNAFVTPTSKCARKRILDAVICDNDQECVSGCERICLGDLVVSSSCNEADHVCVCECDTGTECVDGEVVVEPYPTSTECDSVGSSAACDSSCESDCIDSGFPLGSVGAACTTNAFGNFCECDCAYCRPN